MELVDRVRRVWLVLYRAYKILHQRGLIGDAELEEAVHVLERLDELSPDEIRSRLGRLGRRDGPGAPTSSRSGGSR